MIAMDAYDDGRARFAWWLAFAGGLLATLFALQHIAQAGAWMLAQTLVGVLVVGLTALFTVRIPGAKTSIAAAEIFIFLMLLVLGPAPATLAAVVEGAVGAMRSSKHWTSRLGTPALAALAMAGCGHLFAAVHASLPGSGDAGVLLLSFGAFAALYALVTWSLSYALFALKNDARPGWVASARGAGWFVIAYVCSASLSGMMFLSFRVYGSTVLVVGMPIIGMFLSTLHLYFRQRSIRQEADATAEHLEAIRASESRFHSAFTHAAIGMALVSTEGRLVQVNDSLCAMLGRKSTAMTGADLKLIAHPDDFGELLAHLHHLVNDGGPLQTEQRFLHADGRTVWCALHAAFFSEWSSNSRCLIFQIQDVTSRRVAEAQLVQVAYHDDLTSLPNRAHFSLHLGRAIAASRKPGTSTFAVMYIDFDRFKVINDSLGHKAGDAFLKTVAARLKACLRTQDVIARLGGDEFAILLQDVVDPTRVLELASRLIGIVAVPVQLENTEVTTSASIGITFSTMGYDNTEDVLRDADIAMYKAKASGKAQFAVFDTKLHEHVSSQLKLEGELRRAMLHDQLVVHYQPLFCLRTSRLRGFEALVRWNHPERGMVDPGRFVPIAEEAGLIVALGEAVFDKACRQLHEWEGQMGADDSLCVNINVSGVQLGHPEFVDRICATMRRHGVRPHQINIEVTESVLMDAAGVIPVMRRLASMGFKLSIDDFGTGYSSLSYLHSLPFDTLKIDRSFVDRLGIDGKAEAIVKSIVALGRALGKSLVAEGIETESQLAILRAFECDAGQGYLFSRPLAPASITPLLVAWRGAVQDASTTPAPITAFRDVRGARMRAAPVA